MRQPEYRVYVVPPHSRSPFFRLRWYLGGILRGEQSSKTKEKRQADKAAAQLEADLNEGRYRKALSLSWSDFTDRYETEHLNSLAVKTRKLWYTTLNHVNEQMKWKLLADVNSDSVSQFQAKLLKLVKKRSVVSYMRALRAAINWASDRGLLAERCNFSLPKIDETNAAMRGRPIKLEEFERMLTACPKVRPDDAPDWQRFLVGLWLSGLRLGESLTLSWCEQARMSLDASGKHLRIRMFAETHKGRRDQYLPITPDFETWLLKIPAKKRKGKVLGPVACYGLEHVSDIVGEIGRKANVLVEQNQYATAHDLRRSFGTRWAARVKPARLKLLMRHTDIKTTMQFYVAEDSDDVAADLWREHSSVAKQLPVIQSKTAVSCGTSYGTGRKK